MDAGIEPSRLDNQGGMKRCEDHVVPSLGKPLQVTPKIKKDFAEAQRKQKEKRLGRQKTHSQSSTGQLSTPTAGEGARQEDEHRKPVSMKILRTLFPSTSATRETFRSCHVALEQLDSVEDFDCGVAETRGTAPPSRSPFMHEGPQLSGKKAPKHRSGVNETDAPCSGTRPCSKRRRLYSQPVGLIEPPGSVSGSQGGDCSSTALALRPKPPDTASRTNESVYDQLLRHSEKRASRAGRGGIGLKKASCGRKSAPPRVRSPTAPSPVPATVCPSPRPPRRLAATAAVGHLRDSTSDNGDTASQTSGPPPAGDQHPEPGHPESSGSQSAGASPGAADAAAAEPSAPEEDLERGSAEVFYLPTVVRSDDEDSDGSVSEEGLAARAAQGGRVDSDAMAVERDSIWPSSDPDWLPTSPANQSSPETSQTDKLQQGQGASATDSSRSAVPGGASGPVRHGDRTDRRSGDGDQREVSGGGPNWADSGRPTCRTGDRAARTTCYSRVRPASPDRNLRRYSILSGTEPERSSSSAQRTGRSRSRSRSSSRGRGRADSGGSRGPAARAFFSVDPDTECPSAAEVSPGATGASGTSDSVSRHQLVVEQDPCWYRLPRRELGPNVSSESSSTRRRQASSPPRQPRQRSAPWTYGRQGPDAGWADRQPAGGPWRQSLVPPTLSGGTARPSSGTARPSSGTAQPSGGTAQPSNGTARPSSGAARPSSGAARPGSGTAQSAADRARQPAEPAPPPPPSRSRQQPDLEEPGVWAADWDSNYPDWTGQAGDGDAAPESEPEPVGAGLLSERTDDPASRRLTPSGPRPVPADLSPVRSAPQPVPSGPRPVPADLSPVRSAPQPVPSGPRPAPSDLIPVRPAPQPVPSGLRLVSSSDAHHVPSGSVRPGPQTLLPSSGPRLPDHRISSELAQLVVRWRRLARLEQQTVAALRSAQRHQQQALAVQRRLHSVRLHDWRRARAGLLAACDVLERLAGTA